MRRLAVRLVSLALMSVLLTAVPVDSQARHRSEWAKPDVVLDKNEPRHLVRLEAGPRRYAVAAWVSGEPEATLGGPSSRLPRVTAEKEDRVWVSVRGPRQRRFRRPRPLSDPGVLRMDLAVARNGQTVITWVDADLNVQSSFRDLDTGWSEPEIIAGPVNSGARLAVGPRGTAVATWRVGEFLGPDEQIQAAVRLPGGSFGAPSTVARYPDIGVFSPVPAVGRGQRGLVVWSGPCPPDRPPEDAKASFLRSVDSDLPAWDWSAPEEIPNSTCPTSDLHAVMDDDGAAVVMIDGLRKGWDVLKFSISEGGVGFSKTRLLSDPGRNAGDGYLGVTRSEKVIAVWDTDRTGAPLGVYASVRPAGKDFRSPRRVSSRRGYLLDVAGSRRGQTIAIWRRYRSSKVFASFKPVGRWFRHPERFPVRLAEGSVLAAMNPRGRALSAWGKPQDRRPPRGVFVSDRRKR